MKAVRWHARGDVRLDDIPVPPPPAPFQITVDVAACGICGSDVHEYRSGPFAIPVEAHPHTGQHAPLTLGHEISAWVTATVAEVEHVSVGDLVALNALIPCENCDRC